MNRILISGGNGFLGSFLTEKALKYNFEITVVDDFSTMKEINIPDNIDLLKKNVETFSTEEKFDYVIHLAARPSPEDYINHPINTILSNWLWDKIIHGFPLMFFRRLVSVLSP